MSNMKAITFALAFVGTIAVNHGMLSLTDYPPPMPNFDLDGYMGRWFTKAFMVPPSIQGFRTYTDYSCMYTRLSDDLVSFVIFYRTPHCVNVTNDYFIRDSPGQFLLKDGLGDSASGTSIVVYTDYVTFAIKWGCTEVINGGSCRTPYVVAKTRDQNPSSQTWEAIADQFRRLWGLELDQMTIYDHNNHCYNDQGPTSNIGAMTGIF